MQDMNMYKRQSINMSGRLKVNSEEGEKVYISTQGMQAMMKGARDPEYPGRNVNWTDDFKVELPINVRAEGTGSLPPITLIQAFQRKVKEIPHTPAFSSKRTGQWQTTTYHDYYESCMAFASSLISYGFDEYTSLNIIGFNAPEWFITFYGAIFAKCLPTGIYTTNNQTVCEYIAQNSQCKVVIAENWQYAKKYLNLLDKKAIQLIIIYDDKEADYDADRGVISWNDFLKEGKRVDRKHVQLRMRKVRPGNCATIVYTSGTTGMPKGVMLSHDNFTWTKQAVDNFYERKQTNQLKMISYLPLSHVAGMMSDIVAPLMEGAHIFFANPDALQGGLIDTLREVRPNYLLSVPRVWEKIETKMKEVARSNGWLKTKIANWAKSIGPEGTFQEIHNQPTSFQFKLAKMLVFNNVKKALGLENTEYFLYGSAPLDPKIRQYFLSLNIFLANIYGMSESTGPQNMSDIDNFDYNSFQSFKQAGKGLPGTELKIMEPDKKGVGQICYRGRNRFMGYYKNPKESAGTIDENGYLHSGDLGYLNKKGVLFITGRAKELIVTSGGENIPPLVIENEIKEVLPFVSNVMVVGDKKKFLTCLIAVKEEPVGSGKIQQSAKEYLQLKLIEAKTIPELRSNLKFHHLLNEGLKAVNSKAISRAHHVQDYYLLPEDFSVENGLITPTLKLKRNVILNRYKGEIQLMYTGAKM